MRPAWQDELDREFRRRSLKSRVSAQELGIASCGRNAGFVHVGAPSTYYDDDDALREDHAEEDVSEEEALVYPSRVIENDKDEDLIKKV